MALLPWRKGKVIRIENETAVTKRYWIEVPELTAFDFIPGQFVTLDLPIHEKANKRWRSYSIASWPDGTNVFELIIVLDKKGAGTNYIFDELRKIRENFMAGKLAQAQQAQFSLLDINSPMYEEGNPVGVKYLLSLLGVCQPYVRLPLLTASQNLKKKIEANRL